MIFHRIFMVKQTYNYFQNTHREKFRVIWITRESRNTTYKCMWGIKTHLWFYPPLRNICGVYEIHCIPKPPRTFVRGVSGIQWFLIVGGSGKFAWGFWSVGDLRLHQIFGWVCFDDKAGFCEENLHKIVS